MASSAIAPSTGAPARGGGKRPSSTAMRSARNRPAQCGPSTVPRIFRNLFDVLDHPFVDHMRDLEIVLLDHHHVAVAMDAFVLQPDEFGPDACLTEILGGAVIVGLVIGGL